MNNVCGPIPHSVLIRNINSHSPVFDHVQRAYACALKADGVSSPTAHTVPSLAIMLHHACSRGGKTPKPRGEIERAPLGKTLSARHCSRSLKPWGEQECDTEFCIILSGTPLCDSCVAATAPSSIVTIFICVTILI